MQVDEIIYIFSLVRLMVEVLYHNNHILAPKTKTFSWHTMFMNSKQNYYSETKIQ